MINRSKEKEIKEALLQFPIVAIIGPRQCGKTTLAKQIISNNSDAIYLDLELPSDKLKLTNPESYFSFNKAKLICIDEIQTIPNLFPILRAVIDKERKPGKFLILGSASPDLLRQGSETLAGRISFIELSPFLFNEIKTSIDIHQYWLKGGFPESILANSTKLAFNWLSEFTKTFLERDLRLLTGSYDLNQMQQLWRVCATMHGSQINYNTISKSVGISHTSARNYLEKLEGSFMVRLLRPYYKNYNKRLTKSPKIYINDSGILHSLLNINSNDSLFGNYIRGTSWEGLAINDIINNLKDWQPYYLRTSNGNEVDLIMERGEELLFFEFKVNDAPKPNKGLYILMEEYKPLKTWIITPMSDTYPLSEKITISNIYDTIEYLQNNHS